MDPDYCICGATVRLIPGVGISIYEPPTTPKHGHRHEWQKERTTTARHAKTGPLILRHATPTQPGLIASLGMIHFD